MSVARVAIEVTAGILPGHPEPELRRVWAITAEEWEKVASEGDAHVLLAERNGQAQGYAMFLMLQPDRVNWVRTEWLWI